MELTAQPQAAPSRLANFSPTRRGTPRQRAPKAGPDELRRRIVRVVTQMSAGWKISQIKAFAARQYGLSGKSTRRLIARAQAAVREATGRTRGECMAQSLDYWAHRLQRCESRAAKADARARDLWERAKKLELTGKPTDQELVNLLFAQHDAEERFSSQQHRMSMKVQKRIDKMLGLCRPVRNSDQKESR